MTINKAQGQTLQQTGLYLPDPVFSHGQMYVALSRVGSPDLISVFVFNGSLQGMFPNIKGTFTQNITYTEVFSNRQITNLEMDDQNETIHQSTHETMDLDEKENTTSAPMDVDEKEEEKQEMLPDIVFTASNPGLNLVEFDDLELNDPEANENNHDPMNELESVFDKPGSMTNTTAVCWGNATIQALFSLVDFTQTVVRENCPSNCPCSYNEFCLFCILENTIQELILQENEYVNIAEIARNASNLGDEFNNEGYNDAVEFFASHC